MSEPAIVPAAADNVTELPAGDVTLILPGGEFIEEVDNDRGDRPRWAQIQLWTCRLDESKWYLIYTIGHSVIYHENESPCGKGIPVPVPEFPLLGTPGMTTATEAAEDLEACERCRPGDWRDAGDGDTFDVEYTWYRYQWCRDAAAVLDGLRREAKCRSCFHKPHRNRNCWCKCREYAEAPRVLSIPGRTLVEKARRLDRDLDAAARRKVEYPG